ncbi:MAG: sugar phosphate isomerase/epimerase [Candidatus Bathyarchaeota archaeon]|nr:MAG: sugar phosphate isomerase/epimerase [Candidatus Bathyarchaeota archaeon]
MSKPKIGLSMLFCLSEPFTSLLKRLKKVDVDYVELLDEGLHALDDTRVKKLREIAEAHNFEFMVHSPFADINIATPSPVLQKTVFRRLEKSIVHARQLKSKLWIFHPGLKTAVTSFYPGSDWELNMKSVRRLRKIATTHEVDIAIENVPEPFPFVLKSVEDFSRFFNEVDDELNLVLDVGHANINQQIHAFITKFSKKIVHVHASDNKGNYDAHLGIGHGTVDWANVAEALKRIDFNGVVVLESIKQIDESLERLDEIFG